MAGARESVWSFLAGLLLVFGSSLGAEQRFTLTVKIENPPTLTNSPLLKIELKNISTEPQKAVMLEELFEGTVYLRDSRGEMYPFILRRYWNMLVTGIWSTPEVKIAPGATHVFRHALSEFIDWRRTEDPWVTGKYDRYAILSEEFGRGCEMWCELEIREMKPFGKRGFIARKTGTVRSPPLIDIRAPLLYDPSGKVFQKNHYAVDYAPLLTRDERDQFKTGDELYAEFEERRSKERAKYSPPLRLLMEARDSRDDSDMVAYKRALNEVRRNPTPELFRQFAEWIDERTCQVPVMFESLLFDGYLKLDAWDQVNWREAQKALVDTLPHVKTSAGLEKMLTYIIWAQGGGRFQFEMPDINAKIDFSIEKTANGRRFVSTAARLPLAHLRQAGEECRKLLRERYPDLR